MTIPASAKVGTINVTAKVGYGTHELVVVVGESVVDTFEHVLDAADIAAASVRGVNIATTALNGALEAITVAEGPALGLNVKPAPEQSESAKPEPEPSASLLPQAKMTTAARTRWPRPASAQRHLHWAAACCWPWVRCWRHVPHAGFTDCGPPHLRSRFVGKSTS